MLLELFEEEYNALRSSFVICVWLLAQKITSKGLVLVLLRTILETRPMKIELCSQSWQVHGEIRAWMNM